MKSKSIATGEIWRHKGDTSDWMVVSVCTTHVGLTGPGPCRSYQEVELEDFLDKFQFLEIV